MLIVQIILLEYVQFTPCGTLLKVIYGILVSGMNIGPSIFKVNNFSESLLSGGAFGAEGGLACTIVLIISTLLVIFVPRASKAS